MVGILAVALNLRCAVTSVGAVLGELNREWRLPGLVAGLLTALPVVTFALVGGWAPRLAGRFGAERTVAGAMLLAAAGLAVRATAGGPAGFLAASGLALAGAAIGNVLLPPLVKRYFPDRVGLLTALYSTALAVGMTGGAALTVPVAQALGGDWRLGLGLWAGLAAVAVPPWLAVAPGRPDRTQPRRTPRLAPMHRSGTARALACFFGCQSLNAYVVFGWLPTILADAGHSATSAALPLALVGALTVPMSLILPGLAAGRCGPRVLIVLTASGYALGYLGLLVLPGAGAWLWAVLLGVGNGAFPLAMTLIGLRSGRPEVTEALSAYAQSRGYLLAAAGPVLVGLAHQHSGGWRAPLLLLLGTVLVQLVTGLRAAAPGTVEAELATVPAPRHAR